MISDKPTSQKNPVQVVRDRLDAAEAPSLSELVRLLEVGEAAEAVMRHGLGDGSECSTEYICDGDCDVAIDLWRQLAGLLGLREVS